MLLRHIAGYAAHRTIATGLRTGLISELAGVPAGLSAEGLAAKLGADPFYVAAWCRAAFAAGLCDRVGESYVLVKETAGPLLDTASPGYVAGVFLLFEQEELFGRFEKVLGTGERLWWDECSPEFITRVAGTGTPFYTRLIPGGLSGVPGLVERLRDGCRVLETACGSGRGLLRLGQTYPKCELTGVDGDKHSLDKAASLLGEHGITAKLVTSSLEEMPTDERYTVVINNISMHECRDIDEVARRTMQVLEPGGWFVISDFPFPADDETLRALPGRIMSAIQFFEAQIDDQLLPRETYDALLTRHGFVEMGWFQLTPMHAVTFGRRPY